MIRTENITINDHAFVRTYSDIGMKVEREGIRYDEAIDPASIGRTYTETDEPIESDTTAEEVLNVLLGGGE